MKLPILIAAVALTGLLAFAQDTIKVHVETVQVYTTVTDIGGRFVTNLKQDDFKVFEDGKEQKVDAFSSDDSPISVGIVFDASGLMGDNFQVARAGAIEFLKTGNLSNEYFLVESNNKPKLTEDYTRDIEKLQNHAAILQKTKDDAVVDAVNLALTKLRDATNPRKVLLVFTERRPPFRERSQSGSSSESRTTAGRANPRRHDPEGLTDFGDQVASGADVLESLGADPFAADSAEDFVNVCRRVSVEIQEPKYILGYQSTNPAHDGKYRSLEVKLNFAKDVPDLTVHTRAGYYATDSKRGMQ